MMRRWSHVCLAAMSLALVTGIIGTQSRTVNGQSSSDRDSQRRARFTHSANLNPEANGNDRGNATETPGMKNPADFTDELGSCVNRTQLPNPQYPLGN